MYGRSSLFKLISLLLATYGLTGCTLSYKAIGGFDDYAGVFEGFVSVTPSSQGTVSLVEVDGDITCSGDTWLIYRPSGFIKQGARGEGILECSDGRVAEVSWVQSKENGGTGKGVDQNGNTIRFRYDLDSEVLDTYRRSLISLASKKEDLPPVYKPKETRKEKGFSTGTAFFVSSDGYAVTNFHVIEDAEDIAVRLVNGKTYSAVVVMSDPANDVSLIKIDAITKPLPLAKSISAKRGDQVVVLGYPLVTIQGQSQKATFGRINALSGIQDDIRFFQIDAPIQPGNSGGPLIDSQGNVIGVVTATLSQITTLIATGRLPQNVNYAVKSAYILPITETVTSIGLAQTGREASMAEISTVVERSENSVALVVAR